MMCCAVVWRGLSLGKTNFWLVALDKPLNSPEKDDNKCKGNSVEIMLTEYEHECFEAPSVDLCIIGPLISLLCGCTIVKLLQ